MTELERKRRALINKHTIRGALCTTRGANGVLIHDSAELPLKSLKICGETAFPEQEPSFSEPYQMPNLESEDLKVEGKNLCDLDYLFNNIMAIDANYSSTMIYVGKGNRITVSINEKLPLGLGFYLIVTTLPTQQGVNKSPKWWLYHHDTLRNCQKSVTFTAPQDYVYVTFNKKENLLKNVTYLQVERSEKETEYEPHFEKKIRVPCSLVSFEGSKNELEFDLNKNVCFKKRSLHLNLSSLNWNFGISTKQKDYVFFYTNEAPEPKSNNGFCSHGAWISAHPSALAGGEIAIGFISGSLTVCISTSLIPYTERESGGIYAQVSDLMDFLAENPIYALYALKNEQDIELDKTVYDDICSLIAPYGKSAELSTASPCLVQAKYYSLSKQDESIITVKYLDADENEIAPAFEKTVRYGSICLAEPIHIDGYVPLDGAIKSVARENTVLKIYYKKEKANE